VAIQDRTTTVFSNQWEIEEGDYGDPVVFHRHPAETVPAYIVGGGPHHRFAKCSECMEYFEFAESIGRPPQALI
jgi:hypothetical protein